MSEHPEIAFLARRERGKAEEKRARAELKEVQDEMAESLRLSLAEGSSTEARTVDAEGDQDVLVRETASQRGVEGVGGEVGKGLSFLDRCGL